MSDFFFWFIRPIAEFLGALALVAVLFGVIFVWVLFQEWRDLRRKK